MKLSFNNEEEIVNFRKQKFVSSKYGLQEMLKKKKVL